MGDLSSINHIFDQMKWRSTRQFAEFRIRILLRGLLLLLLSSSRASAEISVPFKAPPQGVSLAIKARRDEPVQISLLCSGGLHQLPKFRIRTQPQFGTLSEPKLVSKDSAIVIYVPGANATFSEDKFSYSVQTSEGVSVPAEVSIRIFEDPAILVVSEAVDFGNVLLGHSAKESFLIENRGGGVAEGTFNMKGDFTIDGPGGYRLAKGERKTVDVVFRPTLAGKTASAIVYSSNPDRQTTLLAEGVGLIQVLPSEVKLTIDPKDGIRKGHLELLNCTNLPQKVEIHADSRLRLPGVVELPPAGKIPLGIEVGRDLPDAITEVVEFLLSGYSSKVQVRGVALGPIFRVTPSKVQFGRVQSNQLAMQTVALENIGGAKGDVIATMALPFNLKSQARQNTISVEPGLSVKVQIELQSAEQGAKRATLSLSTPSGDFQVPVEAEVSNQATSPVPAAASQTVSSLEAAPFTVPPPSEGDASNYQYARRGKEIRFKQVGRSDCELAWEAAPNVEYHLESRRYFLDEKGNLQFSWEPLTNVKIAQEGSEVDAKVFKLIPGRFYTIRAVAMGSGTVIESTEAALFSTLQRPPLITAFRILALCLLALLGVGVKRAWKRE